MAFRASFASHPSRLGVATPGGGTVSQTEVMAICRNDSGLLVFGVESRVDEIFGPTLAEKDSDATSGQPERIEYLENNFGRKYPFEDGIRYQLPYRTVSALLATQAFHAPGVVKLVHSFGQVSRWSNELAVYCSEHACNQLGSGVTEISCIAGYQPVIGLCKGDAKHLKVELPSEFRKIKKGEKGFLDISQVPSQYPMQRLRQVGL